jgi:catechol 2,3-dioxygenase-like lactoylglutathione lyase family enzyme
MNVMPIRYARDVDAAIRFYAALGLRVDIRSRSKHWAELASAGAGMMAIHIAGADDAGDCELAFEAQEPLEKVVARLTEAGFAPQPIVDENYGRSVRVQDPDQVWVQVNEHDRELYT